MMIFFSYSIIPEPESAETRRKQYQDWSYRVNSACVGAVANWYEGRCEECVNDGANKGCGVRGRSKRGSERNANCAGWKRVEDRERATL